jgi:ribonuclease P protein component
MKLNTIKKRSEFLELREKGHRVATKGVVVEYMPILDRELNELSHYGFTVSGKVGSAVYRNKAKRKLKEAVRVLLKTSPRLFKENYRYNFIGRFSTIDRDLDDLMKDIKYALHQSKKQS